MIVKQLAVAAASAALVLGVVVPAFAETNVSNLGVVLNLVGTSASTGGNYVGGDSEGGSVQTGNATSIAQVENVLNTTSVDSKGLFGSEVDVQNVGVVLNLVGTSASTGGNHVGGDSEGGSVQTGNAGAESVVSNVVNTTVVKTTDLGGDY